MHAKIQSPDGDILASARYRRASEGKLFNSAIQTPGARARRDRRPIPPPPGTNARRSSLAAAGSSVVAHVVEGFALCATSMHPEGYWQWSEQLNRHDSSFEPPHRRDRDARSPSPGSSTLEAEIFGFLPLSGLGRLIGDPDAPADMDRSDAGSPEFPTFGRWIASIPGKLWSGFLHARARARARAEWETLDDRTLRDIGVSRHEIPRAVRHPRWI
jgi:uncharacterized protein YjiS (DUF1127 family)